ncbi:MAG TPA: hypothetical protein VM366_15980 [Anaerolineae bacterium]|nr:hypothetical protein [Anaerolineae bacterium]
MSKRREPHVLIGESCPECGGQATLWTTARGGPGWVAYDGDPVGCVECGTRGHVSADDESPAEVVWDEEWPLHVLRRGCCDMAHRGHREGCPGAEGSTTEEDT